MALTNIIGPRTPSDIRIDSLELQITALEAELLATRELTGLVSFGDFGADPSWLPAEDGATSTDYGSDEAWTTNAEVLHNSNYGADTLWAPLEVGL